MWPTSALRGTAASKGSAINGSHRESSGATRSTKPSRRGAADSGDASGLMPASDRSNGRTAKYGDDTRVLPALHVQDSHVCFASAEFLEQTGLARAGLAHDVDDASFASASESGCARQNVDLTVTTDQWERTTLRPALERLPDDGGIDRDLLAFDEEGRQRLLVEAGQGTIEHGAGRNEVARRRVLHETGREVHRVSHHGEGAPAGRAEDADEYRAAVHSERAHRGHPVPTSSRMNRPARSIRSSSSPNETGAPAASTNLPPSGYTSLASQCTPNSVSARDHCRGELGVDLHTHRDPRLRAARRCART